MSRRTSLVVLALAMAVGAALRGVGLGDEPLWLDEAYSYLFAQLSWIELARDIGRIDHNPPLYYVILKLWSGVFGWEEVPMRLASVLVSVATIPVLYALGRSLGGGEHGFAVGAGAAAIVAVHPVSVDSAMEVRSYGFLIFALAVAFLCAVRVMRGQGGTGAWLGLLLSMAAAVWLHNLATTVVVWIGLALFLWAVFQEEGRGTAVRRTLAVGAGLIVLWLPALWYVLDQAYGMSGEGYWVGTVNARRVLYAYGWDLAPRFPMDRLWLAAIAAGVVAGTVFLARRCRGRFDLLLVAGALVVPAAVQVAVSLWVVPLLTPRTLAWMVVVMAPLLAAACAALPGPPLRLAALLVVVGIFGVSTVGEKSNRNDWRGVVAMIAERAGPNDLVVLTPGQYEVAYAYYAERNDLRLPLLVLPGVIPGTPRHTGPLRVEGCTGAERYELAIDAPECPLATWDGGVWFISLGRPNRAPTTTIEDALAATRTRDFHEKMGRRLRVSHYTPG